MNPFKIFILIVMTFQLISCQKNKLTEEIQPEILTATYETMTRGESERGYNVLLEVKGLPKSAEIKQILLNKRLFDVHSFKNSENNHLMVEAFLPLQSRMIQNFKPPKPDNRPDGIIFEIDGKTYFYEIKFEL